MDSPHRYHRPPRLRLWVLVVECVLVDVLVDVVLCVGTEGERKMLLNRMVIEGVLVDVRLETRGQLYLRGYLQMRSERKSIC